MYRESEAQTDPYTPDYIIPVGATQEPEVLTLSSLVSSLIFDDLVFVLYHD
jgi:hypothetical protein